MVAKVFKYAVGSEQWGGTTIYNTSLPTASLNVANTYNKASVFFDFGRGNGG